MSAAELSRYTAVSKYAQHLDHLHRRETWEESVARVESMMLGKFPALQEDIRHAYDFVRQMKVLGSQRAMQFGGPRIIKHNASIFNCLKDDTSFITSQGVKTFKDFHDGDEIEVFTHTGTWKKAMVRCHGEKVLYRSTFHRRGGYQTEVWSTSDHRWLTTKTEKTTQSLVEGDVMCTAPDYFSDFVYEEAAPDERLYWAYGFVYGDGTLLKDGSGEYRYSAARLCGEGKKRFISRFEELGFTSSTPKSFAGDIMVYTGQYLKEAPDPSREERRLVRAFVRGYLDADGQKQTCKTNRNVFSSIQATGEKEVAFIRRCFPVAGVYLLGEKDLTGQETNFGIRPYTIIFRIVHSFAANTGYKYLNTDWTAPRSELVWSLEVEEDHSFVLPNGLVTGNCISSYCDRLRFFQECFYLLLCGCGTGFSVQEHHVARLPWLSARRRAGRRLPRKVFRIPDNITGWADAAGVLLSSYHDDPVFPEYHDCEVEFDPTLIRKKRAKLSFGIGTAPGPDPLLKSILLVRALLEAAIAGGLGRLTALEAYDIVMHLSDAVLAGGVRRSAAICIFSAANRKMVLAKTGDWQKANPQRGRSNNSAALLRQETTYEQFKELFHWTREYGEPGVFWTDDLDILPNPCGEIGFWPQLAGKSGWQACNLTTLNGKTVQDREDFYERCEVAATIGTLQAAFTSFPYLGHTTEEIVKREALLGVSISGIMHHPEVLFDPEVQRQGAAVVLTTNERFARKLGINPCARGTCVKPDGNSSSLMGGEPGIRAGHSRRFFRIVQANRNEAPYRFFRQHNPLACEPSSWSRDGTDDCIRFCLESPQTTVLQEGLTAIDQLENIRRTFENWVEPGKVLSRCTHQGLSHNVSNTVFVKPDEWDQATQHIYQHRDCYAGITLAPTSCDRDYYQAPYTAVYTPREQRQMYGPRAVEEASNQVSSAQECGFDNLWDACRLALVEWDRPATQKQKDWAKSVHALASLYFDDMSKPFLEALRRATYCLKDAFNWSLWEKLQGCYQDVDYTQMVEEECSVALSGEVACGQGECLLS